MRVAVAGGTGLVGRHVVQALREQGHAPVVLARGQGVDLVSGEGLREAMRGVEGVVDVSNVTTTRRSRAVAFFEAATKNLLDVGRDVGVHHHVVLSIVGVDRVEFGYYEGKLRQERLAMESSVPTTIFRAAQFHEFAHQILERVRGPLAFVPRQLIQPVAAAEVAAELVATVVGDPRDHLPEFAGPEEHQLVDLARRLVRARGQHRAVVGVRLPGKGGRAMASGELLPREPARHGKQTFDQWLAEASA